MNYSLGTHGQWCIVWDIMQGTWAEPPNHRSGGPKVAVDRCISLLRNVCDRDSLSVRFLRNLCPLGDLALNLSACTGYPARSAPTH